MAILEELIATARDSITVKRVVLVKGTRVDATSDRTVGSRGPATAPFGRQSSSQLVQCALNGGEFVPATGESS